MNFSTRHGPLGLSTNSRIACIPGQLTVVSSTAAFRVSPAVSHSVKDMFMSNPQQVLLATTCLLQFPPCFQGHFKTSTYPVLFGKDSGMISFFSICAISKITNIIATSAIFKICTLPLVSHCFETTCVYTFHANSSKRAEIASVGWF